MKFVRQHQATGRRRVDFHIRRNRQTEDEAMFVNADIAARNAAAKEVAARKAAAKEVAARVIRVRREPGATEDRKMVDRIAELDLLFGT